MTLTSPTEGAALQGYDKRATVSVVERNIPLSEWEGKPYENACILIVIC